ncbi:ubiquinol-cytochrome C chaperone family protein [Algimonas porphyrae]|uniref:Ubiquinol-cytochrome c chaperone n=1 Tax=Algimonas porphyrae TaxID=1128113 RepID=A0ABQ5UV32_9PROT|nr:ubiquinol-cytochrome C chaperone family protein [Algimonas porphyrae]GLQ19129.1 ubiquinol-cytochrome c chaperone [Algimonas porphyrae]
MGLFGRLMGRDLPERRDARRIYFRLLEQSRDTDFYGHGKLEDTYDGRIDAIAIHFAVMMERLREEGDDGRLLSQALFDEMKDDFEIALREEGISDTGVKKRIKPMIGHFYDRLKAYSEALQSEAAKERLSEIFDLETSDSPDDFQRRLSTYMVAWLDNLHQQPMKALTEARFSFPSV